MMAVTSYGMVCSMHRVRSILDHNNTSGTPLAAIVAAQAKDAL